MINVATLKWETLIVISVIIIITTKYGWRCHNQCNCQPLLGLLMASCEQQPHHASHSPPVLLYITGVSIFCFCLKACALFTLATILIQHQAWFLVLNTMITLVHFEHNCTYSGHMLVIKSRSARRSTLKLTLDCMQVCVHQHYILIK